jgi:hypothetical protein
VIAKSQPAPHSLPPIFFSPHPIDTSPRSPVTSHSFPGLRFQLSTVDCRPPLGSRRVSKAQKPLPASPLFATLTYSLSRKSFPCHSYANTRGVGSSRYKFLLRFPPVTGHESQVTSYHALARSLSLFALFSAPRSFVFNRLRTLLQKHRGWGTPPHSPRPESVLPRPPAPLRSARPTSFRHASPRLGHAKL